LLLIDVINIQQCTYALLSWPCWGRVCDTKCLCKHIGQTNQDGL